MNSELKSSPLPKAKPFISERTTIAIGFAFFVIVMVLDIYRPFRQPWSDLYYLVGLYAGLFLRKRAELWLYACLIVAAALIPFLFWNPNNGRRAGMMHRATGIGCGMAMIGMFRARRRYIDALQSAKDELETKVELRTAELQSSYQRLELLSHELIRTQEAERHHLARELHDQIGQVLTALKMNLRRAEQVADPILLPQLESSTQIVDEAIDQVRNLTLSLRPPQLDQLGLVAALHWLVKHQGRAGAVESRLDADLGDAQIPADMELVCFRIAQEALTNAIRHARPSDLHVKLWTSADQLHLSVKDNGVGFDIGKVHSRASEGHSVGLINMRERANLVGGQLEIESGPENGTRVHATFPLSAV